MMQTRVGDRVIYRDFLGGGRVGTVTGAYADVKNGRPGFDLITDAGETVWGYDSQIVAVNTEGRP